MIFDDGSWAYTHKDYKEIGIHDIMTSIYKRFENDKTALKIEEKKIEKDFEKEFWNAVYNNIPIDSGEIDLIREFNYCGYELDNEVEVETNLYNQYVCKILAVIDNKGDRYGIHFIDGLYDNTYIDNVFKKLKKVIKITWEFEEEE